MAESSTRKTSMISTHAPRTGSDEALGGKSGLISADFNPRSPHGERQHQRY